MKASSAGALLTRLGVVDVLSWNPLRSTEGEAGDRLVNNFGDLLGPILVERIAGPTAVRHTTARSSPPVLLTIGSILHFAPKRSVVWGSGVNFKLASKLPAGVQTLDIRAVRGPYSARAIRAGGGVAPAVFGDPALLLPRYLPELSTWSQRGQGGVLVVPNLNDHEAMSAAAAQERYPVLDARGSLNSVLRAIAGSGFVIGSSLHAIAVADSLGIPARFVGSEAEGVLKFRDYLAGSGRPLTRIATDLDEAVSLGGHSPVDADLDALVSSFPRDLWSSNESVEPAPEFSDRPLIIAAWRELLTESHLGLTTHESHFLRTVFPAIVSTGRAALDDANAEFGGAEYDAFVGCFADAYSYRVALAPGLTEADVSADDWELLRAVDTGCPDSFLRALWLQREGAHALLRVVRQSSGLRVFSIAFRPGTLTNDLVGISLVCEDHSGARHVAEIPLFAMYHRQWSIDLCASIDLAHGARVAAVDVRATHADGATSVIPVVDVAGELMSLNGFPYVRGASRWSEQSRDGGQSA